MEQHERHISLEEVMTNPKAFFEWVVRERTAVVVENETGQRILVQPDRPRKTSATAPEQAVAGKGDRRHPADRLEALQARIQAHRGGQMLTNLDGLLEANRHERDDELSGLH